MKSFKDPVLEPLSETMQLGARVYQALLNAVIGFVIAAAIGYLVVEVTAKSALPIVITPWLVTALFALTVAMCVASAIGAIFRVVRIDPATVFMR